MSYSGSSYRAPAWEVLGGKCIKEWDLSSILKEAKKSYSITIIYLRTKTVKTEKSSVRCPDSGFMDKNQ